MTCWTVGTIGGLSHGQTQCCTSTSTTSSQEKTKETTEDSTVVELSHCQKVSHPITTTKKQTSPDEDSEKSRRQFKSE